MYRKQAPKTQFHTGRKRHFVQIDQKDRLVLVPSVIQLVLAVGGSEVFPCDQCNEITAAHDDAGNVLVPFASGDQPLVVPDAIAGTVQTADDCGGAVRVAVGVTDEYVGLTAAVRSERRILISHGSYHSEGGESGRILRGKYTTRLGLCQAKAAPRTGRFISC